MRNQKYNVKGSLRWTQPFCAQVVSRTQEGALRAALWRAGRALLFGGDSRKSDGLTVGPMQAVGMSARKPRVVTRSGRVARDNVKG